MKVSASKDLAKLTTISSLEIDRLIDLLPSIASHHVLANYRNRDFETHFDIGIGDIVIIVGENDVRYKFIPSSSFSECINNTINEKHDHLESLLEEAFTKRLLKVYKDLL